MYKQNFYNPDTVDFIGKWGKYKVNQFYKDGISLRRKQEIIFYEDLIYEELWKQGNKGRTIDQLKVRFKETDRETIRTLLTDLALKGAIYIEKRKRFGVPDTVDFMGITVDTHQKMNFYYVAKAKAFNKQNIEFNIPLWFNNI